jgi:hypothetical protein
MKKKVEKVAKDKQENVSQLKSLFALFTQQRKALEISIQKNKKLEEDNIRLDTRNKSLEEQQRSHSKRVEQLELEKDMLSQKARRDREALDQELEERRTSVKKLE